MEEGGGFRRTGYVIPVAVLVEDDEADDADGADAGREIQYGG